MSILIATYPEGLPFAMRQVRRNALKPQVSREAVPEVLQPLMLDTMAERTTLTQAVEHLMVQPPGRVPPACG